MSDIINGRLIRLGLKDNSDILIVEVKNIIYETGISVLNTLHHYALVYSKEYKKLALFVDGQLVWQLNISLERSEVEHIHVGFETSDNNSTFRGNIDNFRISDVMRWTNNFVLPMTVVQTEIAIPVQSEESFLEYNEQLQEPEFENYDPAKMSGEWTPQINAGIYDAYFTPLPGYCWPDGTRKRISVPWQIERQETTIEFSTDNVLLSPNRNIVTVKIYSNSNAVWTATPGSPCVRATRDRTSNSVTLTRLREGNTLVTINYPTCVNYKSNHKEISVNCICMPGEIYLDTNTLQLSNTRNAAIIPYKCKSKGNLSYNCDIQDVANVTIQRESAVDLPNTGNIILTKESTGRIVVSLTCQGDIDYSTVTRWLYLTSINHGKLVVRAAEALWTPGLSSMYDYFGTGDWIIIGSPWLSSSNARFGKSFQTAGNVMLYKDISYGSTSFTIDFWYFMHNSTVEDGCILSIRNNYGRLITLYRDSKKNKLILQLKNQKHSINTTEQILAALNHIALVYDKTKQQLLFFINGRLQLIESFSVSTAVYSTRFCADAWGSRHLFGCIDEVRISKITRWTDIFTTSYVPYESDSNTMELLHFESPGDDVDYVPPEVTITVREGSENGPVVHTGITLNKSKMETDIFVITNLPNIPLTYSTSTGICSVTPQSSGNSRIHRYTISTTQMGEHSDTVTFSCTDTPWCFGTSLTINIMTEIIVDIEDDTWEEIKEKIRNGEAFQWYSVGNTKTFEIIGGDYEGTYKALVVDMNEINKSMTFAIVSNNKTPISFTNNDYSQIVSTPSLNYNHITLANVPEYVNPSDKKNLSINLKKTDNTNIQSVILTASNRSIGIKVQISNAGFPVTYSIQQPADHDAVKVTSNDPISDTVFSYTIEGVGNGESTITFSVIGNSVYTGASATLLVTCNKVIGFSTDSWETIQKNVKQGKANMYDIGDSKTFSIVGGDYKGEYKATIISRNVNGNNLGCMISSTNDKAIAFVDTNYGKLGSSSEYLQYNNMEITGISEYINSNDQQDVTLMITNLSGNKITELNFTAEKTSQTIVINTSVNDVPIAYENTESRISIIPAIFDGITAKQKAYTISVSNNVTSYSIKFKTNHVAYKLKEVSLTIKAPNIIGFNTEPWERIHQRIKNNEIMNYYSIGDSKTFQIVGDGYPFKGQYKAVIIDRSTNSITCTIASQQDKNIAMIDISNYGKLSSTSAGLHYNTIETNNIEEYINDEDKIRVNLTLKNSNNTALSGNNITLTATNKTQDIIVESNVANITIMHSESNDIINISSTWLSEYQTLYSISAHDNGECIITFSIKLTSQETGNPITLTVNCTNVIAFATDEWSDIVKLIRNPDKDFKNYYSIGDTKEFQITEGPYTGKYKAVILNRNNQGVVCGIMGTSKDIALVDGYYGNTDGGLQYNTIGIT